VADCINVMGASMSAALAAKSIEVRLRARCCVPSSPQDGPAALAGLRP
jgi:hypothetical protein